MAKIEGKCKEVLDRTEWIAIVTEENLKKDNRVELLIASKQVQGNYGPGQGCCISGIGELQTSGKFAQMAKEKFPWARGAFVIKVKEINTQL